MELHNRRAHRVRTSVRIAFVGVTQDFEGEAHTLDLSFSGCRAICQQPPPKGTKLQVSLYLTGLDKSLSVESAVIRWVRKKLVGIEFYSIPEAQRQRLHAWILKSPYGRSEDAVKARQAA